MKHSDFANEFIVLSFLSQEILEEALRGSTETVEALKLLIGSNCNSYWPLWEHIYDSIPSYSGRMSQADSHLCYCGFCRRVLGQSVVETISSRLWRKHESFLFSFFFFFWKGACHNLLTKEPSFNWNIFGLPQFYNFSFDRSCHSLSWTSTVWAIAQRKGTFVIQLSVRKFDRVTSICSTRHQKQWIQCLQQGILLGSKEEGSRKEKEGIGIPQFCLSHWWIMSRNLSHVACSITHALQRSMLG